MLIVPHGNSARAALEINTKGVHLSAQYSFSSTAQHQLNTPTQHYKATPFQTNNPPNQSSTCQISGKPISLSILPQSPPANTSFRRKDLGDQAKEKVTPDSQKSTLDQAKEGASGAYDRAAGAV